MGNKVKWGVMGTASIAAGCTIPGMQKAGNCELYAIAGRSLKKAEEFKERFGFEKAYEGYDALLADPEVQAVYIPLPNDIHLEWVVKALDAGKHVLCEKPIALNETELRKMFKAARNNGVYLMEAYAYLHSPFISELKRIISSGEIGEVDYIDTAFLIQDFTSDFRLHKELGGGGIYDVGCYSTTMILNLVDSEIDYIKADAEFYDDNVDHMASVLLKFKNGIRASFHAGMLLGKDSADRYDRLYIHGSKGYIRADYEYNQEGEITYKLTTKPSNYEWNTKELKIEAASNYTLEIEQLGRVVLGVEKPHITEEFSIKNIRLIDRILDKVGYIGSRTEYILDNGLAIPAVGFGSFMSTDKRGEDVIKDAITVGYKYIDTAAFYNNEETIGRALKDYADETGKTVEDLRKDLIICSKVWPAELGREKTLASFEESCRKLGTDYLDIFLIHWPKENPAGCDAGDNQWLEKVRESWKLMEDLYEAGRIKAIGLSNFLPHHIEPLMETARINPMVDQLELHVGYMQEYALSYLKDKGILPIAWSPLGRGSVLNDPEVSKIAGKYGKTNAQILLRYLLQRGIPVIPKASSKERMLENLNVFGFEIGKEDMSYLSCLPQVGWSGEHPDLPR